MKKKVLITLSIMCMTMFFTAIGEVALPKKQQTKNNSILSALSSTEYKKWNVYIPTDTEIDGKSILSTELYKKGRYFPVVVAKDTSTVFVLLEREGRKWKVAYANPLAVQRDGFILTSFRIDSNGFVVEDPRTVINFTFKSKTNQDMMISLNFGLGFGETACTLFDCFFTDQRYPVKPLSGSVAIFVNATGYTFSYYDNNSSSSGEFEIVANPISSDIESFDLNNMPLFPYQVMKKASLNQLFRQPIYEMNMYSDISATNILYVISGEEEIYFSPVESIASDKVIRLVQYKDTLGYIIEKDNIAQSAITDN